MSNLCIRCGGTGQYMGNGMMLVYCDCDDMDAKKETEQKTPPPLNKIDRRSAAYRIAISNLMKSYPKLSRHDAIKLFNDTYDKV